MSQQNKQPSLSSLFSYHHIASYKNPGVKHCQFLLHVILLLMYSPIGIMFLVLRTVGFTFLASLFFLVPHCTNLLPVPLIRNLMVLFGVWVKVKGEVSSRSQKLLCCNHCTAFDVFPFLSLFKVKVLIDKGFFETSFLAKQFQNLVGAVPIDRSSLSTPASPNDTHEKRMILRNQVLDQLNQCERLLWFPEGWDTNGKIGLMMYQKYLFSIGEKVQPVALRVTVPLLPFIEPGILGSSIIREIAWLFFSPYYLYEMQFLEPMKCNPDETDIQFAKRVQSLTAKVLKIQATDYSYKDALQLRTKLINSLPTKLD